MTEHGHTIANTTSKEEQTTKQRSETRSAQDGHHHGLLVVGVARPFCLARTAMRLLLLSICVFFRTLLFFSRFFGLCFEFAFKKGCIWMQKRPDSIHTPFIIILVFRID